MAHSAKSKYLWPLAALLTIVALAYLLVRHQISNWISNTLAYKMAGMSQTGYEDAPVITVSPEVEAEVKDFMQSLATAYDGMATNKIVSMTVGKVGGLTKMELAKEFINNRKQHLNWKILELSWTKKRNPNAVRLTVAETLEKIKSYGDYDISYGTPTYILKKANGGWRIVKRSRLVESTRKRPLDKNHEMLTHIEGIINNCAKDSDVWLIVLKPYQEVLSSRPKDPFVLKKVGDCYRNMGEPTAALDHYLRAAQAAQDADIALGRNTFIATMNVLASLCHYKLGVVAAAKREALDAIKINPYNSGAYALVAQGLEEPWDRKQILSYLRKANALDPMQPYPLPAVSPSNRIARDLQREAQKLRKIGKHNDALAKLDQAIVMEPSFVPFRVDAANCLYSLGRYQDAIKQAKECISLDPDDPELHNRLGVLFGKIGDRERAVDAYRASLEINPFNKYARANLGSTLRELNRLEEASKILEEGRAIMPTDVSMRFELGKVYYDRGLDEKALDEWMFVDNLSDDPEVKRAIQKAKNEK